MHLTEMWKFANARREKFRTADFRIPNARSLPNLLTWKPKEGLHIHLKMWFSFAKRPKSFSTRWWEGTQEIFRSFSSERNLIGIHFQRLFATFAHHSNNQNPMENHTMHLIRVIVAKYLKVRINYNCSQIIDKSESVRQLYGKIILFRGQWW